ncbi:hypothetical protein G6F68_015051 [Rhizopus microsporus]|nr:hypothetical protein G6F68_015051 [Rhizopus microsporus]
MAAGTGRHVDPAAPVAPAPAAGERAGIAHVRGIAQFVGLHVDFQLVALHRHLHPGGTGYIHACAIAQQRALARVDHDLAAGGQGQRPGLGLDRATGDDFHARLVAPILQPRQVVERALCGGTAHLVLGGRLVQQCLPLAVERGGLAIVLKQDGRGGIAAEGHAGLAIAGGA